MAAERFETFASSQGAYSTATLVSVDEFETHLAETIEEPAVGTALPFEDISYGDVSVSTDWTPADLEAARTGVTVASAAIAATGTVVLETDAAGCELVSLYPKRHVIVTRSSDIVADLEAGYASLEPFLEADRGSAILATGPSATADMGTLVYGVHGPHEVRILVVEDR